MQKTKRSLAVWFDGKPALDAQAIFNALPDNVVPDMPPEVAALVEVKASREFFVKHFTEIEKHGGLPEVLAYIEAHPQNAEHKAPASDERPLHYAHLLAPALR